jgi:pimeloyl-ACP methyl ester carboxylesterase
MSRRVLTISFVFLFVFSPFSLSWPTTNFSQADTPVNWFGCYSTVSIDSDTTWTLANSPYVISYGEVSIAIGKILTIEPGVIVKLDRASISVFGKLEARGNSEHPIIFTSINDDSRGGTSTIVFSNGNPQPGDWGGISIWSSGEVSLKNAIINYGSGETYPPLIKNDVIRKNTVWAYDFIVPTINVYGGKLNIEDSEISHNIKGIEVNDNNLYDEQWNIISTTISQVSIHGSKIFNNPQGGVLNNGTGQVDATNNWWGHNSGPYNLTFNAYGQGDSVSDNVLFLPYTKMNTTPKRNPVIIVPGILGSYLNDQTGNEVWPSISTMLVDPWDSYLNKLALPSNGVSTGSYAMVPHDIFRSILNQDFFQGLITELEDNGYQENRDLFVFPYDWRLDIGYLAGSGAADNPNILANKIQAILDQTQTNKIDIVAHSMGGLIVKKYLKTFGTSSVNSFIDIATPHLGAPQALKVLMFGDNFDIWPLNSNKVKSISQNFPSIYQLLPSKNYFDSNNVNYKAYLADIYDYDNNNVEGNLNYDQSREFMKNTGRNNSLLEVNDNLHNEIDNYSPQSVGVKTYNVIGCSKPTLGKIYILNKERSGGWEYGLKYINGDGTVPLRSAEYFEADKSYYSSGTEHAYLPGANGIKQLVTSILKGGQENFDLSSYPSLSSSNDICSFSGTQIEYHSPIELHVYDGSGNHLGPDANGDIEMGIAGAKYDIIDNNKFAFLPAGDNYEVVGQATETGTFNADVRIIKDGEYVQTAYFNELPLDSIFTKVQMDIADNQINYVMQIDQNNDGVFESQQAPAAVLDGIENQDLTKPITTIKIFGKQGNGGWYTDDIRIKLTAKDNDSGSGILKTEYSLDNGSIWIKYDKPFSISEEGTTTIIFQSTDRAGNVEINKEQIIKIDKNEPDIDTIIPYDGQEFFRSDVLEIVYDINDGQSGTASVNLSVDGKKVAPIISLAKYSLGEHVIKIEAEDAAGNKATIKISFSIVGDVMDINSTINDIKRLYDQGAIYKGVVETTLINSLEWIKNFEEKYGKKQEQKNEQYEKALDRCKEMRGQEWCNQHLRRTDAVDYLLDKIYQEIVKAHYQSLFMTLDFYKQKDWLSKNAYDIIKSDIKSLINI